MRSNAPLSSGSLSETIFPAKGIVLHGGWEGGRTVLRRDRGNRRNLSVRRERTRSRGGGVVKEIREAAKWRAKATKCVYNKCATIIM